MYSNVQPFDTPRLTAVRKSVSWFSVTTISQKCRIFMIVHIPGENLLNLLHEF